MSTKFVIKFSLSLILLFPIVIFASTTDGTIINQYAWGENSGWVNFAPANGNIHITDSTITGYAWDSNYGWINMNPTNAGVINDSEGNLSGYAWSQGAGYINFQGVTINSSGTFTGQATGSVYGRINFDCSNCSVTTDWRPASTRAVSYVCNNGSDDDGDSLTDYPNDPGCSSLTDNDETNEISPEEEPPITQSSYGSRKIATTTDMLAYNNLLETPAQLNQAGVGFLDFLIPNFLKPKKENDFDLKIPAELIVKKEAPLVFLGKWTLLPKKPINQYVLAPLPNEIRTLAKKFPEFEKTLEDVGVTKITDTSKLSSVKFTLPGLTESTGIKSGKLTSGKIGLPQGIPLTDLSAEIKKEIPSEIVFARGAKELVDFDIALSISPKGETEQKISTIVGKKIQLVVKPENAVKSIKGYVVFKKKNSYEPNNAKNTLSFVNLNSLSASALFSLPKFAKEETEKIKIEEEFVLLEFEYEDPDGDGIYTAEITAPLVDGEYEIITVMDYNEPTLAMKAIKLTTVVDPEGYVYEINGDKETRIPGAIVSIYWLNPETKQYTIWPADKYHQENPQTTDVRGTYSFLVPMGMYYLSVLAPGYSEFIGKAFEVKEGNGVHYNIELKSGNAWLRKMNWSLVALIIVIILLAYNFYRDKLREKSGKTGFQNF